MSDEYKDRYIIIALLKTPPWYYRQYNTTVSSNTELNKRVVRSNTTKDLPNTHRRSTAGTAMNPIGQTFPVIHIHLRGNSEQPPQLLNVGRFETSSDMRSDHLLFSTETNIQIPMVNNASHIVAEIFHDYGMHHLTCEIKTFKKKLFVLYRLSACCEYFTNDVYGSLSHPMLRQSSPKYITYYFNSRQTTIAERHALNQYFKSIRWY